jgi:predicted unusual protein kinase regulating ubiquinone biosynthesis (AarF/ABC1/UbiB family)
MSQEKNRLTGRVKRYARVAGGMAGVGAKMAKARVFKTKNSTPEPASRFGGELRLALGGLKGPLMKVAQMLATIPDLVPPELAAELAQLQADAPPMGWAFVKRRMAGELGIDWEKKFKHFEREAFAAASLGQVHRATSLSGQKIVCKLQYPDMASAVAADLQQLKLLLAIFERYDRAVDTSGVQLEIAERLHEELDYQREAKHLGLYRLMLGDLASVSVPELIPELSTPRLLSMGYLAGERFMEAVKMPQTVRNTLALNMFHVWYRPFYEYGVIHGDPHMGNYTIRADHGINLLDFGCIRIFKPELVQGVIELYQALLTDDDDRAVAAYRAWGFTNPSKSLIEVLNIWARFIYAPLMEDRVRSIDETNTGLYGRATAAKVHQELRKLGGVKVPRAFVFMDRAAVGLGSVFLRLGATINWYRQFQNLITDFELATMAKRQQQALRKFDLPSAA